MDGGVEQVSDAEFDQQARRQARGVMMRSLLLATLMTAAFVAAP
jgi:hypothetical protein